MKKVLFAFVFLAPFTAAFAINSWLRVPVLVLLLFYVVYFFYKALFRPSIKNLAFFKEDFLLGGFLLATIFSTLFNEYTDKTFSNLLAYYFTVIAYFLVFKLAVKDLKVTVMEISRVIYHSAVFCCCLMILDFILMNFFSIEIRPMFINLTNGTANMNYYFKAGVFTVGGVAEEPGSMALLLNIYCFIALFHAKKYLTVLKFNRLFFLYVCAIVASGSIGAISLAMLSFFILKFKQVFSIKFIFISIMAIILAGLVGQAIINGFINEFQQKLVLSEDSASAVTRVFSWKRGFEIWAENPLFGKGPGYGKVINSGEGYLSFFITILADFGAIAFIFITAFFVKLLLKALRSDHSKILAMSLLTTLLHLWIIGDFYHAPFWILLIFIQLVHKEHSTQNESGIEGTYPRLAQSL